MDMQAMVERQQEITQEMTEIRFMQKGTISSQRVPSTRGGTRTGAMRGPYRVLTWKQAGKTRSLRLKTEGEVSWAEQAISNYRRFVALCKEYEELGESIAHKLRLSPEDAVVAEGIKKKLK